MKKHLLCLTIDTDPDGLSGQVTNRRTLNWDGLERVQALPERLGKVGSIPVTWFVRADGQLESILGDPAFLLAKYERFWNMVKAAGHELGWHPHLYRQATGDAEAALIADPHQAREELERLWAGLKSDFHPTAFRNGEGWHTVETYSAIESMGFLCDSTAIPGRSGPSGHPMDWHEAPNRPYFPADNNLRECGPERPMIEIPMNTWRLHAPYDASPKLRYMNPAVHPHLFAAALESWKKQCLASAAKVFVWVMIFHPDEVMETAKEDGLYARSPRALIDNLFSMEEGVRSLGDACEWVTVSDAAERWRESRKRLIA
ncbi:MAG TPA: hypothetical protein VGG04_16175 [Candidatus Sulfotelmatobacter sp.]